MFIEHCGIIVAFKNYFYYKAMSYNFQEMVEDREGNELKPRYLCYDVVKFEGMSVGKESFYPVRLSCIDNEVIRPR